ncbi:MAG: solute:sodium symporter family transporter [Pseudomonadales bacterium]
MTGWSLLAAVAALSTVGGITWAFSRGRSSTPGGYFLAGRSLTAPLIAGSLLLTNISTEQLVGLAGSAYATNLSSMAWEVTAGVACIVMALWLLPRYLAGGFTTLPEFLASRYDSRVRRASALLFLLGYTVITLPSVLYSGSLAVMLLTDATQWSGVSETTTLFFTILVIAGIGGAFAIAGGLRAVAVSDTLFGIGLLAIGAMVPILGLVTLGSGSLLHGWQQLLLNAPEKLNAIGGSDAPTPIATVFTGMLLANLFYWGTNQYVVQRTLAARSLAAGQIGVLVSGFFKVLVPFFVMLPGIIAWLLYGPHLASMDMAYPTLVRNVLPAWLQGLFLAVVIGVVASSFNSLVNSAATLLSRDFGHTSAHAVRTARWQSVGIIALSIVIAPQLAEAGEGLWQVIRRFTGFYNIPVVTLVLVALLRRGGNPVAALWVMVGHIVVYGLVTFGMDTGLHFIHWYAILFAVEAAILLLVPRVDRATPDAAPPAVDLTPWRYRYPAAALLVLAMLATYALFSPIGIAQ